MRLQTYLRDRERFSPASECLAEVSDLPVGICGSRTQIAFRNPFVGFRADVGRRRTGDAPRFSRRRRRRDARLAEFRSVETVAETLGKSEVRAAILLCRSFRLDRGLLKVRG